MLYRQMSYNKPKSIYTSNDITIYRCYEMTAIMYKEQATATATALMNHKVAMIIIKHMNNGGM